MPCMKNKPKAACCRKITLSKKNINKNINSPYIISSVTEQSKTVYPSMKGYDVINHLHRAVFMDELLKRKFQCRNKKKNIDY